jgi:hypothetical protein
MVLPLSELWSPQHRCTCACKEEHDQEQVNKQGAVGCNATSSQTLAQHRTDTLLTM